MRRDIWLAGLAGVVLGSWLTLVAVQVEEHGLGALAERSETVADNRPTTSEQTPVPTESAKTEAAPATVTPAETPPETASQQPAPATDAKQENAAPAQPAVVAEQTTPASSASATTPSATTLPATAPTVSTDNGSASSPAATAATETPATAAASTPAVTPTPTPTPTHEDTATASAQQPAEDKAPATKPATEPQGKTATGLAQSETAAANTPETQPAPKSEPKTNATKAGTAKTSAAKTETAETQKPDTSKSSPTPSSSEQAKIDQAKPDQATADQPKAAEALPDRMPADQMDREAAAAAHMTAPPKPATEEASLGGDQKPAETAPKPVELIRPFADSAGILTIAGRSVQLPGIVPTDVDRVCTGPNGKSWPCGTAARTAFRMYLRGRTIDCDLPSPTWQGTVTGACRYVRIDLSEWLVRFGWAEPEAGSSLVALAEQAKEQKRGIYGDDPRRGLKSTLAPALPKDDPLNPI